MLICSMLLLAATCSDGITSDFIAEGITKRTGGYSPIRAEMDKEASIVKKAPEGLKNPKFGWLELNDQKWAFIMDEPEEEEAKWFVDSNGDGDLTNDPATEWELLKEGGSSRYNGGAKIDLGGGKLGRINAYRFDPNDKARAQLKNTLLFYTDFGTEYTVTIDGEEFKTSVAGSISKKSRLWLDRDHNGRQSRGFETVAIDTPFNYTGTTFVFTIEGNELKLTKKLTTQLPRMDMPPDLTVGKPALTFEAKTLDGSTVSFPKSYAGKIVMLDCWATWCGPCIGEIPHMKEAYSNWHDKGFEILGVSFDSENMDEKLKEFLTEKELPWQQIYEGKGWETSIGKQHDVSGIPFVLLVDGDSGEILATAKELRGAGLSEFIGKMLEAKKSR